MTENDMSAAAEGVDGLREALIKAATFLDSAAGMEMEIEGLDALSIVERLHEELFGDMGECFHEMLAAALPSILGERGLRDALEQIATASLNDFPENPKLQAELLRDMARQALGASISGKAFRPALQAAQHRQQAVVEMREECARVASGRAIEYRKAVVGTTVGHAMALQKVALELDEIAAAIRALPARAALARSQDNEGGRE